MTFEELNLHDDLLEALHYMRFEEATPIQEQAIPIIQDGKDLIACAQTGTGKTAAFVLPLVDEMVDAQEEGVTRTLIIVPTRELALQIDQQIQGFTYFVPLTSIAVYGGADQHEHEQQKKALSQGADIVVATPGKLISHLNMGYVKFDKVQHLVLDEADRMLDMGFVDDIKKIIGYLPKKRQTLLFSATMPPKIRQLCKDIQQHPEEITLALSKPAEGVLQAAYLTYPANKNATLDYLINDKPNYESILIFTSTKSKVFEIVKALKGKGYTVSGISSDLDQKEREDVLMKFKSKQTRVLVATDVLSRGIDIKDIDLVVNYDCPQDAEDYVHRVGRTARAKTTGVALTLISPDDMYRFARIEKLIEREVMKLPTPPEIGESPAWNAKGRPPGKSGSGHRNKGGHKGGGRYRPKRSK